MGLSFTGHNFRRIAYKEVRWTTNIAKRIKLLSSGVPNVMAAERNLTEVCVSTATAPGIDVRFMGRNGKNNILISIKSQIIYQSRFGGLIPIA